MEMNWSAVTRSIIRPGLTSRPRLRSTRPKRRRLRRRAPLMPMSCCSHRRPNPIEHCRDGLSPDFLDVVLVLEHDAQRLFDDVLVERVAIERDERRGPLEGLGDAWHFVKFRLSQLLN